MSPAPTTGSARNPRNRAASLFPKNWLSLTDTVFFHFKE